MGKMEEKLKNYKKLQKIYPKVILGLVIVLLLLFLFDIFSAVFLSGNSEYNSEKIDISDIIDMFSISLAPFICIIFSIITSIKFKKLSKNEKYSLSEYLEYSFSIKKSYIWVYIANIFVGIICIIFVFTGLMGILLFLLCGFMLFQTGRISKIGIRKLYECGKIDLPTCKKYTISQYILFLDVKTLRKICDEYLM